MKFGGLGAWKDTGANEVGSRLSADAVMVALAHSE